MIDLAFVLNHLPELLKASLTTVTLTLMSSALAGAIGLPLAIVRESKTPLARVVAGYSWILLTTPSLLLLYLAYFALPSFGIVLPAFETAVVGMAVSGSAYQLEIFRAGIISVQRGQVEAARALGIPENRIWRRVILPQALPVVIPPYISNLTIQLKGTSLAAIITVPELTGVGLGLITLTLRPFEILAVVGVVYLVLNSALAGIQVLAERKFGRH